MIDQKPNTKGKFLCILLYIFAFPSTGVAQIVPDTTLPVNSIVNTQDNNFVIEGGTQVGSNLFHSFAQFSVPTNGTAFFNNAAPIQNIFSRVTGNSISNIDGLIKANGNANLFLINPNGIIFGANASLNIGGSFLASTANSFVFKDGNQFSATNPQAPPLLTINLPIGLQFEGNPGEITVEGNGHNLIINENEAIANTNRPLGLSANPGNTLALIGGNVNLKGGNITAHSGRIELWSVVNGELSVVNSNGKIAIETGIVNNQYGDIQLSNAASLDASGNGGEIQVQGRKVSLREGSTIFAITQDTEQGGNLAVKASDSVELIGTTITADNQLFRSSLLSQSFGEEKGSDLIIETGNLIVEGGQAADFTFGAGNAGNLTIRATELVDIKDIPTNTDTAGGLFSQVKPEATGNGGNLTIETNRLTVKNGAQVSTLTEGEGRGGNLTVQASESVQLIGSSPENYAASGLFTETSAESTADSGVLTIITAQLQVLDGAEISASTYGTGNAGNLLIRASELVELSGSSGGIPSGIFAQVNQNTTGTAGNLTIETEQLIVRDGGQISAATFGEGKGGNLIVRGAGVAEADLVELSGISAERQYDGFFAPSGLFATTNGTMEKAGNGGNLIINARRLIVRDGAQVAASTLGTGAGGSVTVNASESVELIGIKISPNDDNFRSSLLARTKDPGTGAAGNIEVNSPFILLADRGFITTDTRSGDFGNIELTSNNIQLRQNSSITTNTDTSTGGNITINTDTIAALENSDITANAARGFGGRVTVNTQGIFGTAYRENLSEITSDITATSELGPQFNGVVEINTPDVDPTQGLVQLPNPEPPRQIARGCPADEGSFIVTGSGGLPANPSEALRSNAVVVNWVTLPPREENRSVSMTFTTPKYIRMVEAQGWVINAEGEVVLTEQPTTVTPYNSGGNMAICHRSG